MHTVFLDFESFWATDYSLTKLSPLEYVMGDQFETISCAIKVNDEPTEVFFGEAAVTTAFDARANVLADCILVGHNMSGFDAYICAYRFGLNPKMWGCTAAMARPLHAKTCGVSLKALVQHYRIGVKDNTALLNTKGKRLAHFTTAERAAMAEYNKADTDQCCQLFHILRKHYSPQELWQIDALTRMRTEPAFVLDVPMLESAAEQERDKKRKSVLELGRTLRSMPGVSPDVTAATTIEGLEEALRTELASAAKFSALLDALGAEVPLKDSPTNPEKQIPALAKTDEGFLALQEHENPVVAAAALARLSVKSTLLETRIQKFLTAGRLAGGQRLPVPLQYCGADTTGRDSGCLVADTEVLVYDCLTNSHANKRIVDVLRTDLVWDGGDFVSHGGVVFSGYAEVINWDGVTGTEDHIVFTEIGEVSLSDARSRGLPITLAGYPTEHQMDAARKHVDNHKATDSVPVRLR